MNNKRNLLSFILLLTFILVTACSNQENSNLIKVINVKGDFAEHYEKFDELVIDSEVIVEISVTATETVVHGDLPFTLSTADIKQSLKGSYKTGDKIKVLETGGKFYPLDKENNPSKEEHELIFEGIRVMNSSDTYIVFLEKYIGPITDDSFVIKGLYQGRFNVKDNIVSQENVDGHTATSYSKPQSLDEFIKKINLIDKNSDK